MTKTSNYNKIMELSGHSEMKAVVKQWEQVANSVKLHAADVTLAIPNLLWKTSPGSGKTYFLKLLSEYLDCARLLDFYGDVKFLEFYLYYCPPNEHLNELTRLIGDVRGAAGFRSEYRGILAIDISEWETALEEANFLRVLEYLSSINHKVCIIFIAENFSAAASAKAEQILCEFCRIRSVDFTYPNPQELASYCVKYLEQYQLKLDTSASNVLEESIAQLMKSDYFNGYKTLNRLCQDIAFDLCAVPNIQKNQVTEHHIATFHKDVSFADRLSKINKKRSIGFEYGGKR